MPPPPPSSSRTPASPQLWPPLLLLPLLLLASASARRVQFDNTQPMRDREGRIMDAHDGSVQRFDPDGPFYMHAVAYGLCTVRLVLVI